MLGTTIFQRGWKKLEEKLLEQQYIDSSNFDLKMSFLLEGLMALTMVRLMVLNCLKLK